MKHPYTMRAFLLMILLAIFAGPLWGQQSEVRVVKPYSPTLSGAQKIQQLPNMEDEIPFQMPEFSYELHPKLYNSAFRLEPIKAARMVQMPLTKLYKSELTMGIGNYLTPLVELNVNQLRSRKGTLGLHLKHHSMNGKLKLNDELKIPAGFMENKLRVDGNRFFENAVLNYGVGTSYNSYVQYGVDTTEIIDIPERDSLKESYFLAEGALNLHSMHADSFHFNYTADLAYYYFTHQFNEAEHGAKLRFQFDKKLRVIDLAGDVGAAFYGHHPDWDLYMGNHTMVWLNPLVAMGGDQWDFKAGFNTYLSIFPDTETIHFYPRGSFEFKMVDEVIMPFFGVDGYLESNNYRKTVEENPYVLPTLGLKPTSHKMIGYAGVKGRISPKFSYMIKGSYSLIDNQYFFVNDTSQVLKNQFTVVYSDITQLNLLAEFTYRPNEDWKVFLKGNYYHYTLSTMDLADGSNRLLRDDDHPWNRPDFDISLEARYNLGDKILVNMGIYTIGKRYYEDFNPITEESLPLTVDANLGLEYRYSKLLTFWARINNLAAQRYYLYHQYPSYRFRVMLGFKYAL